MTWLLAGAGVFLGLVALVGAYVAGWARGHSAGWREADVANGLIDKLVKVTADITAKLTHDEADDWKGGGA